MDFAKNNTKGKKERIKAMKRFQTAQKIFLQEVVKSKAIPYLKLHRNTNESKRNL